MSEAGKMEIVLPGIDVRKFWENGDTITIRDVFEGKDGRAGFGECVRRVDSAEKVYNSISETGYQMNAEEKKHFVIL